jgi:3-oxoacyl-[acyl-carrier protein] reductase
MVDKNRLSNRTALITGCGSEKGIGFATAGILARSGARVAITSTTDRIYDRAGKLEKKGLSVKPYVADLMDRAQVKQLVEGLTGDFGRIDILVNNAGMVQVGKEEVFLELVNLSFEAWDESTYITGQVIVIDGGNTIQEYKGPSELYY